MRHLRSYLDPSRHHALKVVLSAVCACWFAVIMVTPANAIDIQKIKTGGGLEAWLVEDHSIPLVAIRFAFEGGAALEAKEKAGLAHLASGLLDEGAGDLKAKDFQQKLQEKAIRLSFRAGKDWFTGQMQTLTENRGEAFKMLRLALTKPRFDKDPVERVRSQIMISIKRDDENPQRRAGRAWMKLALGGHPYARSNKGTSESLKSISIDDLKTFIKNRLVRNRLKIAVVGDIKAAELAKLLDETFGGLPEAGNNLKAGEAAVLSGPAERMIEMNIPQTIIQFGHEGFKRHDKDFIPAYIINYILGGGGFSSRLTREIRVKRGLSYSVYSYLNPMRRAGLFMGGAATRADRAAETVKLIRGELSKMASEGPSQKELDDAKTYLMGSYALRFDTNSKIAGQLLGIQMEKLGIDYVTRRNDLIRAVTIADVKRVAKRLLKPDAILFAIVGKPQAKRKIGTDTQSGQQPAKKPL